ncbi:MAG: ribosome maturation factor RimP [Hyphomonadaceae bacterium]
MPLYPHPHIADASVGGSAAGPPGSAAFCLPREPPLRATNPVEERVIALIEPTAAGLGYRIVRVRLSGNRRKRLQIMGERVSDGQMGIDDCTKLSRALGPVFDLEDPVQGEYDLEISSPGIDRPLMRIEDFERFVGFDAKVETAVPVNNQRRWKGVIQAVDGDEITLATEHGEAKLKFSALSDARLVLTDKLIEDDLRRAKAAEAAGEQGSDEEEEA